MRTLTADKIRFMLATCDKIMETGARMASREGDVLRQDIYCIKYELLEVAVGEVAVEAGPSDVARNLARTFFPKRVPAPPASQSEAQ